MRGLRLLFINFLCFVKHIGFGKFDFVTFEFLIKIDLKTEAQTRKEIIDNRLKQAGWNVTDRTHVIEEFDIIVDFR